MQWNVLEYVQYRDKLRQKYIKILILVIIINIMQVGAYDGLKIYQGSICVEFIKSYYHPTFILLRSLQY